MIKEITIGYPYRPSKGCFGYSSCLMVNSEKKVLFDVGGYNIRILIMPLIKQIDCVVISHLHFDHCSNLDLFVDTDIPIYISKKEIEYYKKNCNKDIDLFSYFNYIKDKLNICEISQNKTLDKNIKIIMTPGHTPGHMSLEINENNTKILMAGDSLKSYKDYKDTNSYGNAKNKYDYINTKKSIKEKYSIIYPGHSGKIVNGIVKEKMEVSEF